jgi:hypothetical protein
MSLDGGAVVTKGFNDVAASASRATASVTDFARANASAKDIVLLTGVSATKARDAVDRFRGTAAETASEIRGLAAAQQEMAAAGLGVASANNTAAAAVGAHGLQLGRLNMELGTAAGRMLGMNTATTRLASMLSGATFGYAPVLAAVGAVVALAEAWKMWNAEAIKAEEQQKKLTQAAEEWYKVEKMGVAGERKLQLEAEQVLVAKLTVEYEALKDKIAEASKAGGGNAVNSTFSGLAGGIGSTNSLFQGMAGGVGSQGNVFATQAATGAAAEALKALNAQKAIADALRKVIDDATNDAAIKVQLDRLKELEFAWDAAMVVDNKRVDAILKQDEATRKANQSGDDSLRLAQQAFALAHLEGDAREHLANAFDAENQMIVANRDLTGAAQGDAVAYIGSIQRLKDATIDYTASVKARLDMEAHIADIGAKNKAIADAQQKQTAEQIAAQQKYVDDMKQIWASGFDRIITDGTKSFHDFFDDVLQMFSKLMARMKQEGNASGLGYQLLGLGSAAIGGGLAGYQIGQATGSTAGGILGGAASGAALGSAAGPWGAVIGGLAGAAGGLIGAASAHKAAAQALQNAANAFKTESATFIAAGSGNSITSQLAAVTQRFEEVSAAYLALIKQGANLGPDGGLKLGQDIVASKDAQLAKIASDFWEGITQQLNALKGPAGDYQNQLYAINKAYADNIASASALHATMEQQQQITDLYTASLNALNAAAANDAFFAKNQAEADARLAADNAAVADAQKQQQLLQDSLDTQKAQLDIVTKQLDLQQKTVDGLRATVDALHKQSDSLNLSSLSPLSANDRYLEAKRQYDLLSGEVAAGDQSKIGDFTAAQTAFLTESRAMFGSSGRFAQDFQQAQTFNATLTDHFTTQLTTEEKILAVLQSQSDSLNYQISLMTAQLQQLIKMNQTYVVGSTSDPNFLRENGLAGPTDQIYFPTGGTTSTPTYAASTPGSIWIPGQGWINPRDPGNSWMLTEPDQDSPVILAALHAAGYPGFANGGSFGGGIMDVGERGPERIAVGAARVFTAAQINAPVVEAVNANTKAVTELLKALNTEQTKTTKAVTRQRQEKAGSN